MRATRIDTTFDNSARAYGRPAKVAWFVLLALATLQFAIAQHAAAHTVQDLAESCQFCIQLDDCGHALDDGRPTSVLPIAATADALPQERAAACRRPLTRRCRAPPSH